MNSLQRAAGEPAQAEEEPAPVHTEKGTPRFTRTALALFAGGFATFALLYCVQPMMPMLSQAFAINAAQSSLVLSLSTITLAVGLLVTGPISDAIGRKPVMLASLLAAALFTLGSALMPSWHGVLLMRALVGLALSGLAAVAMTYLSEEIHPQHLGLAMGLYIGGNAIGGMSGRLLSGVLVDYLSWHSVLAVMGGLALLAALLFWRLLPESRHFQPRPLRPRGLLQGYTLHFRDAGLPWLFLQGFLLMGSFVTLYNYIGYRLIAAPFQLSQTLVGLLAVVYLSGIYSSAQVGALADRFGRRRVFWMVIALMLAGISLTLFERLPMVLLGMLLFTFGFFGAHSVASSWIGRRATQARGQASSLYLFGYYLGSSIAGTLGGVFWHAAGWDGVGLFIASLLLVSLAVALHLARLPALPEARAAH
ncbi:MFS transporter [Stutzerimonas stutzeri]|uniref:MFS transporter n=1 Tax=Stutzerimonas stutzeri TaxID=316 RepID=A0A2N8T8K6_STUST|nr:MFS transporter [Stutzerimonas stutzeri]MCQ4324688.1 MFS transporter [Stutzerimonas stutzeri]PNG11049.1 MFS transporter [Stutzerimonas stutzeri]